VYIENEGESVSRFESRQELLDDVTEERYKLDSLLQTIPDDDKLREVVDGMSVKDLLAHRTEWGRMMIQWYREARAGEASVVPTEKYKWNQLKELNAEIFGRFTDTPLQEIESQFAFVHDELYELVENASEEELFTKKYYAFTGSSDLATYFNSASAAHHRSAYKHINKWWRSQ